MKPLDVHYVLNIDLKCFETQYDMESWEIIFSENIPVIVAVIDETPIGYMSMYSTQGILWIGRIGVLPAFRRRGIGTKLLDFGLSQALDETEARVTIPEYQCRPNEPDDASQWLLNRGFRCQQERPDVFTAYGRMYDGYQFAKEIL